MSVATAHRRGQDTGSRKVDELGVNLEGTTHPKLDEGTIGCTHLSFLGWCRHEKLQAQESIPIYPQGSLVGRL